MMAAGEMRRRHADRQRNYRAVRESAWLRYVLERGWCSDERELRRLERITARLAAMTATGQGRGMSSQSADMWTRKSVCDMLRPGQELRHGERDIAPQPVANGIRQRPRLPPAEETAAKGHSP